MASWKEVTRFLIGSWMVTVNYIQIDAKGLRCIVELIQIKNIAATYIGVVSCNCGFAVTPVLYDVHMEREENLLEAHYHCKM
eukprot:CCRYP_014893-RA/>CCRYP_014893-RA protein AED:0.39 eAED:0.39 QI:0/0/0/1/0/0/2/0/81